MRFLPDKLWEVKMAELGGGGGKSGKRGLQLLRIVVSGSHEGGRGGSGGAWVVGGVWYSMEAGSCGR